MSEIILNRAIEKFRHSLTEEQRQLFTASSLDKVTAEIQSIQDKYGSTKKLRSLNRISKFLEAMTHIEQLVQIFLNVSEVVAFVWGPIKLVLMIAGTRVQTLEQLLDTYVEIGEVIPGLRQYEALFEDAPTVLEVLGKYFCDILEFHRNALDVFARPAWKICFDSTWKTFKSRFNPILESLKRHRALLLDERLNAAVLGIRNSSDQSSTNFNEVNENLKSVYTKLSDQIYGLSQSSKDVAAGLQRDLPLQEMNSILTKLDPSDVLADQQMALKSCHDGSGTWIFKNSTFLEWMRSRVLPSCVLFIHGMPGAGKTSLASRIIDHILAEQPGFKHPPVMYYYFKQSDTEKRSMSHMVRALLVQLVRQDASMAHMLYEKCCSVSRAEVQKVATLKTWAAELLKTQTRCTIILDGLDECNHHSDGYEAKQILEWFIQSIIPDCLKEGSEVRLLALGQRDGVVDHVLSDYPSISLDTSALHLDDIRSFTIDRASEIAQKFSLDPSEEKDIIERVVSSSRAMFLYARLVMDNLREQGSAAELDEELNVKFPKGLDEAYERVVFRILDHPSLSKRQKEAAAKILEWLACAVRPLKWREIQSLFCIDPHNGTCNPRNRRVDRCKTICGSFVEIDQLAESKIVYLDVTDPVVNLVHDTARRYQNCIKLLLPYSTDHLNAANSNGETPFHIAVRRSHIPFTKILLKTGAVDLSKRNGKGQTVFEMTKKSNMLSLLHSANGGAGLPRSMSADPGSGALENAKSAESSEYIGDDEHPAPAENGSEGDSTKDPGEAFSLLPSDNEIAVASESPTRYHNPELIGNINQVNGVTAVGDSLTWEDIQDMAFLWDSDG